MTSEEQPTDPTPPETAAVSEPSADSPAEPARVPAWTAGRGIVAVLVALFLVGTMLAIIAATATSNLRDATDDREAVEDSAGRFAIALLNYDYRNLDDFKRRVERLATGGFLREFRETYPGLEVIIEQTESRSEATIEQLYVGEIEDDTASTIAVYNRRLLSRGGPGSEVGVFIQIDLVKVSGAWRVDRLTTLSVATSSVAGIPGASGTTTTAPPG